MKGGGTFLLVLLVAVISILGYYNFQQQNTIQLLNEEILEQARLRHNLILEKHLLKEKLEKLSEDSMRISSPQQID